MAEKQGFLKGISENVFKMYDFCAKKDAEAFQKKKKRQCNIELLNYCCISFTAC